MPEVHRLLLAALCGVAAGSVDTSAQARMDVPIGVPNSLTIPRYTPKPPHGAAIEELLALREIITLALAPDGEHVAFAVQQARPEVNAYASAIFVATAATPRGVERVARKLADVPDVAALQWTVDGRYITYVAPANGVRQVWRIRPTGGEPEQLTRHPTGVGTGLAQERVSSFPPYSFSPDGRYLAYFSWDTAAAVRAIQTRTAAPFRYDETQVVNGLDLIRPPTWRSIPIPPELWLRDLRTGKTERVWTSPRGIQISPDPAATVPPEMAWSPDGKHLAILYEPPATAEMYWARHLGLLTPSDRKFRVLLDEIGWTIFPRWLADGSAIVVYSEGQITGGRTRYKYGTYEYRLSDGSFATIASPTDRASTASRVLDDRLTGRTTDCSLNAHGSAVACVFETYKTPPEVVVADLAPDGTVDAPRVVTDLNPEFRDIRIGETSRLTWPWEGGDTGSALLVKPLDYQPGHQYPVLVMLYNQGIKNRFVGTVWSHWPAQAFAAKGYALLLVNLPRRALKGGDFEGGRRAEAEGPVASIDSALARVVAMGIADTARMGILGWSWGSYVTSYLITNYPNRFKAAASGEGQNFNVSDYMFLGPTVRHWIDAILGGGPYEANLDKWKLMSPSITAHRVKAPVLQEYTSRNVVGGLEFHQAVNTQGGVAELVVYPDEVHVFVGSRNRLASMWLNYAWFNFWLLGEENPDPGRRERYARWREMRDKLAKRAARP